MFVPCLTCRDRGSCPDEAVTSRDAVFAWLAESSLGCEDYQPDHYHGVEGVFDAGINLDGANNVVPGRAVRRGYYVPADYLAVR